MLSLKWAMSGRWYLEYNEHGITCRRLFKTETYLWTDISGLYSKKSTGFLGRYHDTLVVECGGLTTEFFLPDFGLNSKKPSVEFIEGIVRTWALANRSFLVGQSLTQESCHSQETALGSLL
ncbi:MAG: hypothetical protein HXY34_12690, partial [Candidatus Thorarchaeota archaeon]|nr:hypothetical protein [Candidatus Thorarchaeota archaeon]